MSNSIFFGSPDIHQFPERQSDWNKRESLFNKQSAAMNRNQRRGFSLKNSSNFNSESDLAVAG